MEWPNSEWGGSVYCWENEIQAGSHHSQVVKLNDLAELMTERGRAKFSKECALWHRLGCLYRTAERWCVCSTSRHTKDLIYCAQCLELTSKRGYRFSPRKCAKKNQERKITGPQVTYLFCSKKQQGNIIYLITVTRSAEPQSMNVQTTRTTRECVIGPWIDTVLMFNPRVSSTVGIVA